MDHTEPSVIPVHIAVKPKGSGVAEPLFVEKRWGHEKIFINGNSSSTDGLNSYCMKEIFIKNGNYTSKHFHINKHETLYIAKGCLTLIYNDGIGYEHRMMLDAGTAFVIPPGFQHQLCAFDGDVTIIEASTPDDPNDSIRVSV